MATNGPAKLERSLSLTSEPRTLTKKQYQMALASMQAIDRQQRLIDAIDAAEPGPETMKAMTENPPSGETSEATAAAAEERLPA
ncbi:hypothetical protein SDJN03_07387, partial [Cucurbita argyrosperma subsp. sororia]